MKIKFNFISETLFIFPCLWVLKSEKQIRFGCSWLRYSLIFFKKPSNKDEAAKEKNESEMMTTAIHSVISICKKHGKSPSDLRGVALFLEQNPGILKELNRSERVHPYVEKEVITHYLLSFK